MADTIIIDDIGIEQSKDIFTLGNYYKQFPDKILGEAYQTSGKFGTVTKYKGTLDDLLRIEADTDFIAAERALNDPNLSIEKVSNPALEIESGENELNVKNAINEARKNISRKAKKKKAGKDAPFVGEVQSFEEVYRSQNPEISEDELKAFIWYKNNIGQTLGSKWYDLAYGDDPVIEDVDKWAEMGLLYFYNGEMIPAYLYLAENIYDKEATIEKDKGLIIKMHGIKVYENQRAKLRAVFNQKNSERLIIKEPAANDRLIILPISQFAKKFKITTLDDDKPFFMRASGRQKDFGQPDFLYPDHKYVDRWKKTTFEELSLADAFQYWLVFSSNIEYQKDTNYVEIIKFYIRQMARPRSTNPDNPNVVDEEKAQFERVKARAKKEGDRLFAEFLYRELKANDKIRLEIEWNRDFNGYVPIDYNKIPIAFTVGKEYRGEPIDIRPEKREGVAFSFSEGAGCIAYDVGVGKTWTALFAIRQSMDAGYCKRPLVVVPNQTIKQWMSESRGLLPDLPINFLYNMGNDFIDEVTGENGEIIGVETDTITFMTYEGFAKLGFSEETASVVLDELYTILNQGGASDQVGAAKTSERKKESFKERLEMLVGRGLKGTLVNIEDMGFDYICFDEAHKMKKVFTTIKGVSEGDGKRAKTPYKIQSGTPSSIALKGFMVTQYILNHNNNRNILLLTATPFTNSPLEIFSMLSMIAYGKLKETNLSNLNGFFDTYIDTSFELTINAKMRPERRQVILGFNNLVSLQSLIRRFVLHKTGEEANVNRPMKYVIPYLKKSVNGQVIVLNEDERVESFIEMTPQQKGFMNDIQQYAEGKLSLNIICEAGQTNIGDDNGDDLVDSEAEELTDESLSDDEKQGVRILRSMNYGRNLALSPYLFECAGLGTPTYKEYIDTSPKLTYVMQCVKSVIDYHKSKGEPISGQVIYMDRGVKYFELLKEYLVKEIGLKPHEVGIIRSKMPKKKDKEYVKNMFLGKRYNEASMEYEPLPDNERIKVLIGSSTIREGINLQEQSTVLYNSFVDWNPTDNLQLQGRIWRQGNQYNAVRIVIPLMIDTIDAFIFQKLEEKTSRINTIWATNGRTNVLSLAEFDPKELKTALIKDPKILAEVELITITEEIDEEIQSKNNNIKRMEAIVSDKQSVEAHTEDLRRIVKKYRLDKAEGDAGTIIKVFQEVFRTQVDSEGLPMAYYHQRSGQRDDEGNPITYSIQDPIDKPYWFDDFNIANRNLVRETRDFLAPNRILLNDAPAYVEDQKKAIEELEAQKKKVSSPEAVGLIIEEIIERKKALGIKERPLSAVIADFGKLNYLLSDRRIKRPKVEKISCPPMKDDVRLTDDNSLKILERCIEKAPETKLLHLTDEGSYTPSRKKLHQKIIDSFKKGKTCIQQGNPIAILTGGAPGSGKSTFLKRHGEYLMGDKIFKIDADEIRAMLPEYKGWNATNTHLETKDIVEELLTQIGDPCSYDVIFDGTMNKAKNYLPLIATLKRLGYEIFIVYVDVPYKVSSERALSRYKKTGRYIPRAIIDNFFSVGKEVLNQLKDSVSGYMVIDGMTGKIIKEGGNELPSDRNYGMLGKIDYDIDIKEKEQAQRLRLLKLRLRLKLKSKKKNKITSKSLPTDKTTIVARPEFENPVYGININGKDRFIQRMDGDEWNEVKWYEDRKEYDYVPSGGTYPYHMKLLGYSKKEAIDKLRKEEV